MNALEAAARAMCVAGGFDPDEMMSNDGPRWRYYVDGLTPTIAAYFREMVVSETMESAGFGECCGFWPDEQCKEFMPEILKAAPRAHADELEKEKP